MLFRPGEWIQPVGSESLSARILIDPPNRIEIPASARPRIAVHLGRSVHIASQRGISKHRGWAIHGDIEIIPAGTPSIWEPDRPDTAFVVAVDPSLLSAVAEEFGLAARRSNCSIASRSGTPRSNTYVWH